MAFDATDARTGFDILQFTLAVELSETQLCPVLVQEGDIFFFLKKTAVLDIV